MNNNGCLKVFIISVLCLYLSGVECIARNHYVSPVQHGLLEAKSDIDRYWVLYNAHHEAAKINSRIIYKGLDTIRIEIPRNAQSLPLTDYVDFGNTVLIVKNTEKNFHLFTIDNRLEDYCVEGDDVEERRKVSHQGSFLVVVEDENPWVKQRRGYNYGHIRKDVLFVENGRVCGDVISSYLTKSSQPRYSRCFVGDQKKIIKNLVFIRNVSSTRRTQVLAVSNEYNVSVENIRIVTPPNDMYADVAMYFGNCYKVRMKDITIDGTYSNVDAYGYGISLDNVSNVRIDNLKAQAEWGVFGNNNVNNIHLENCDINRFDVHCYGKDIYFERCTFRDLYNQFSSIYGDLEYINCEFYDFIPVLFETTYNSYTKFNLRFKNCKVYVSKNKNYLIAGGDLNDEKTNERCELRVKEYPNLYINGLTLEISDDIDTYYIYNIHRKMLALPQDSIPGVKQLKGISFKNYSGKKINIKMSNLGCFIRKPAGKRECAAIGVLAAMTIFSICGASAYQKKRDRNVKR